MTVARLLFLLFRRQNMLQKAHRRATPHGTCLCEARAFPRVRSMPCCASPAPLPPASLQPASCWPSTGASALPPLLLPGAALRWRTSASEPAEAGETSQWKEDCVSNMRQPCNPIQFIHVLFTRRRAHVSMQAKGARCAQPGRSCASSALLPRCSSHSVRWLPGWRPSGPQCHQRYLQAAHAVGLAKHTCQENKQGTGAGRKHLTHPAPAT